jgi:hypothetical protein
MVSSFWNTIISRAKTLSKTPPKVAGPPPATTFFLNTPISSKTDLNNVKKRLF